MSYQSRRRVPPALTGPAFDPPPKPGDPRVKRYVLRRIDLERPRPPAPRVPEPQTPEQRAQTDRLADTIRQLRPDIEPVIAVSLAAEAVDPERNWRETRRREIERDPRAAQELPEREPTIEELEPQARWRQIREQAMAAHRRKWGSYKVPAQSYAQRRAEERELAKPRPTDFPGQRTQEAYLEQEDEDVFEAVYEL